MEFVQRSHVLWHTCNDEGRDMDVIGDVVAAEGDKIDLSQCPRGTFAYDFASWSAFLNEDGDVVCAVGMPTVSIAGATFIGAKVLSANTAAKSSSVDSLVVEEMRRNAGSVLLVPYEGPYRIISDVAPVVDKEGKRVDVS